jgi:hypothetical protein
MLIDCFSHKIYKTKLEILFKEKITDIIKDIESDKNLKKANRETTNARIFDVIQDDSRFQYNGINLLNLLVSEIEHKLLLFSKEINLNKKLEVSNLWCVCYEKDQKCVPHIHESNRNYSFSGIYYLSFDKNEHLCTTFYNNESLSESITPACEEDDLLIYPADVWHGYSGTNSKKTRIVFPFDICYKNTIKYY